MGSEDMTSRAERHVTIENDAGELSYDMSMSVLTSGHGFRHGRELFVDRMFDKDGSETFDPTQCVEVEADNVIHKLKYGDVLLLRLEVS